MLKGAGTMGSPTRLFVLALTLYVCMSLSLGTVSSGSYSPREWHIIHWVFEKHGYDVAVCLEDMTFIRGGGERAGEVCRIVLPERLRG